MEWRDTENQQIKMPLTLQRLDNLQQRACAPPLGEIGRRARKNAFHIDCSGERVILIPERGR